MNGARGGGGIPVRRREAAPGAQRPPGRPAPIRHRQVCAGGRRARSGEKVGHGGAQRPGHRRGGTGPACAGPSRPPPAFPPAPPARLASCPAPRPAPSLRPRRGVAPSPALSSPGIRAGLRQRRVGPGGRSGAEPDAVFPVPAAAGAMGTPASVASDPPGQTAPAARGRKRASANIFQGVGLPELRSLFRSGGAERPEERARLVWRYAGQRRMARALRRLRRRTARPGGGMAALRRFGRLRIAEEPEGGRGTQAPLGSTYQR